MATEEQVSLLRIKNNAQLMAEEKVQEQQAISLMNRKQNSQELLSLSSYVKRCWEATKTAKKDVEDVLYASQRQRRGVYDPEKLAAIQKQGGSDIFMRLTSTKCQAGEAWINDVLLPTNEKPWELEPTPKPELNPEIMQIIINTATNFAMQRAQETGTQVNPEDAFEFAQTMRRTVENDMREEAKETADRMAKVIEDQLYEGSFQKAFRQIISDCVTYKACILKGPIIVKDKCLEWKQGEAGKWEPVVYEKVTKKFKRVSPFDFYPSPECKEPNDGYIIERQLLRRQDLLKLKGVDGYSDRAIEDALKDYGRGGYKEYLASDSTRATIEDKDQDVIKDSSDDQIEVLEFWGSAQGSMLKEWGLKVKNETNEYEIWAILVGNYIIKAELNSNLLGKRPYYSTSYEKNPESIWGYGVPEKMIDMQNICNACIRAMVNNLAISSSPQAMVNTEAIAAGEDITSMYPFKIWQYQDKSGMLGEPIRFFQPGSNAQELLGIYEKMKAESDDNTGIPRYVHGDENVSGAGRTARGLAMLMSASAKSIKQVIKNLDDDILSPLIEYMYQYNMLYNDDDSIKGDLKIRARGALALIVKEQAENARQDFLTLATNNPTIANIVGEEGIAEVLRSTMTAMDLNSNKIVPSRDELKRKMEQQQMMQQQMMLASASQTGTGERTGAGNMEQQAVAQPAQF